MPFYRFKCKPFHKPCFTRIQWGSLFPTHLTEIKKHGNTSWGTPWLCFKYVTCLPWTKTPQCFSPKKRQPSWWTNQVTFSLALFPNTFASLLAAPRADWSRQRLRHLGKWTTTSDPDIWQAYKPWTSTSSACHVFKECYQNTSDNVEPCQYKLIPKLPLKLCWKCVYLRRSVTGTVSAWEGSCFHSHGSSNHECLTEVSLHVSPTFPSTSLSTNAEMLQRIQIGKWAHVYRVHPSATCFVSLAFTAWISIGSMYGIFTYIWLNFMVYTCITVNVPYMYPMGFFTKCEDCLFRFWASGSFPWKNHKQRLTQKRSPSASSHRFSFALVGNPKTSPISSILKSKGFTSIYSSASLILLMANKQSQTTTWNV